MARLNPKPSRSKGGKNRTKYDIIRNAAIITGENQYNVQRIFEACLVSLMGIAATSEPDTRIIIRGFGTFKVIPFKERQINMVAINGMKLRVFPRRKVIFKPHWQFRGPLQKEASFFREQK